MRLPLVVLAALCIGAPAKAGTPIPMPAIGKLAADLLPAKDARTIVAVRGERLGEDALNSTGDTVELFTAPRLVQPEGYCETQVYLVDAYQSDTGETGFSALGMRIAQRYGKPAPGAVDCKGVEVSEMFQAASPMEAARGYSALQTALAAMDGGGVPVACEKTSRPLDDRACGAARLRRMELVSITPSGPCPGWDGLCYTALFEEDEDGLEGRVIFEVDKAPTRIRIESSVSFDDFD